MALQIQFPPELSLIYAPKAKQICLISVGHLEAHTDLSPFKVSAVNVLAKICRIATRQMQIKY